MCARYRLVPTREELERLLPIDWPLQLPETNDLRPTDPVLGADMAGQAHLFQWGLVPSWARDPGIGGKLFNARSETAAEKPSFRGAFRKRRCILPASEFYEWREEPASHVPDQPGLFADAPKPTRAAPKKKRRYRFSSTAGLFAFAGLWETWHGDDGSELETCTILTTEANAAIQPYHDRMPSILRPEDIEPWLDPKLQSVEALQELLHGLRAEETRIELAD